MYEYVRRSGGLGALGIDDVYEMMESLREGDLTEGQVADICSNMSHQQLASEWSPCRRWIDPAAYCRMERGAACTAEEIAETCFLLPASERHPACARHLMSVDPEAAAQTTASQDAWEQDREDASSWFEEGLETIQSITHRLRPSDSQVEAVQRAVIAAGCTLPQFGADGRWGNETEAGVRCLAAQQSWQQVVQQFPLVAQRMTVPSEDPAMPPTHTPSIPSKIAAAVKSAFSPTKPSSVSTQPMQVQTTSSITTPSGFPGWVPWAAGGFGIFGLIVLGAYITGTTLSKNRGGNDEDNGYDA